MTSSLLRVENLSVSLPSRKGTFKAVDGASLCLEPGQSLAIAGESGSGKSMLCRALLGIEPRTATVAADRLEWRGRSLLGRPETEWRSLRGADIAMIFQDPTSALNPLLSVETQVSDVIRAHRHCSREEARVRVLEVLGLAGLPGPQHHLRHFPSELSGGMRQRVAIAMALAAGPALIIADEATTNLDVSIQAQIVKLLARLRQELGVALIFVTHDLDLAAEVGDRLMVMYAGKPVEIGGALQVLDDPRHPYTRGLLRAAPTLQSHRGDPLLPISEQTPDFGNPDSSPAGTPRFASPEADRPETDWIEVEPGHLVASGRFVIDSRKGAA